MKSLFISVVGVCLLGNTAFCQIEEINGGPVNVPTEGIIDGVYIQEHIPTKRMIPYASVREADAMWSRRVWEYIDLREKINHPLYYPLDEITPYAWVRNASRWSLWTVIRQHVLNGDLRVFSPYNPVSYGLGAIDGDQLKYPIDPQPGLNFYTDSAFRAELLYYIGRLGPQSDVPLVDEYGDNIILTLADGTQTFKYEDPDTVWFDSKDIVQYRMKEDWFLDKQRSVLDVRIIALAPVVYKTEEDANGNTSISGTRELFWLYFPHCRFVFNNYFVYNDKNDSQWMSFDDLFWKRRFNSVIYKESNVYDREIESYRTGLDALHQSEEIKNEIRNIEHDLWSF
jgi:gliding motility associated protien GldN